MKIEITEKKENPLLSRQEVKGILTFNTATPSNDELQANLAKQLNVDKECVRIKKIGTHYGGSKADFLAFVYKTKEELERIEPAPKKWVEKQEKKAAKKEKPAEEKKEVKPKEKKKEKPAEPAKKEAKPEAQEKQSSSAPQKPKVSVEKKEGAK